MLTDLNWLKEGEKFPPTCEWDRMEMYTKNRKLFECEHASVYEENLRRIERIIGNFEQVISYPVVINYQKLMTLKIADLLLGEPPSFETENQTDLETIVMESDLLNVCYMTAIDISRYGDGVLMIGENEWGPIIEIVSPAVWFPVVSPVNTKRTLNHVLAWVAGDFLEVQVHSKGSYEYRKYGYSNGSIGRLQVSQVYPTGLDNFAVVQIPNVITSDRATGIDDYRDVDSIVSELMVRIGQISKILDKHANPSMQGPPSALERDPVSGTYRLKVGSYYTIESKEDAGVSYIVWDAQLAANFNQIEKLINMLYSISEMGSAVLGDTSATTGVAASGTALRRMMVSPLAKVNRVRMRFDDGLKEALRLCGVKRNVDLNDVTITWHEGLPGDPVEEATIIKNRRESQTMSQKRALMQYDGMSEDDAEAEIELISEETVAASPMTPFDNMQSNTTPSVDGVSGTGTMPGTGMPPNEDMMNA